MFRETWIIWIHVFGTTNCLSIGWAFAFLELGFTYKLPLVRVPAPQSYIHESDSCFESRSLYTIQGLVHLSTFIQNPTCQPRLPLTITKTIRISICFAHYDSKRESFLVSVIEYRIEYESSFATNELYIESFFLKTIRKSNWTLKMQITSRPKRIAKRIVRLICELYNRIITFTNCTIVLRIAQSLFRFVMAFKLSVTSLKPV